MVSKPGNISYSSRAILMDVISHGFSYPVPDFYSSLADGDFIQTLREWFEVNNSSSSMVNILAEIESGIGKIIRDRTRENLETEYVGLFEHNQQQAPMHLYAGLYLQSEGGRLEILQRLTRMYRTYGLDMEEGSEHADHITVMLEFLSFLYRQATELETKEDQTGLKQINTDIRMIITELDWAKRLDDELVARNSHPFYLPLSKLLQAVLVQQR